MNVKTLRELCGEAKLDCEAYQYDDRLATCFAIRTGDPVNSMIALVDVIIDNIDGSDVTAADASQTLKELVDTLRSPKQRLEGMDIIMYWPKLKWEEES